jgi:uncharacterized membrane protein YeaQ/YmgE (transglycosylase-associated protein family)
MLVQSIVVWLIVGAIAGWLAGKVVRGGGFGLLSDIAVGIIGSVIVVSISASAPALLEPSSTPSSAL